MITIVGIGADGLAGLAPAARAALDAATTIIGSTRQLALIPDDQATKRPWPSPIGPLVDELAEHPEQDACVLASGDPMLFGIGATLARRLGPDHLTIHPHPSAFALACARLGWAEQDTDLVSTVGRAPDSVARFLQPGRQLLVYVAGPDGAARIAALLRERGFGPSRLVVCEQLGGPGERLRDTTADEWPEDRTADPLHTVAIEPVPTDRTPVRAWTPGLPDDAFETDGQITRRAIRAITLAQLAPLPHELLWDIGAGSGSIGIEWLRAEPTAHAIAVEARPDRAARAKRNAHTLGVPQLEIREGHAPAILPDLHGPPDAIFVGGGMTEPGMLDACMDHLEPHGRIVVNAVTVEGEGVLLAARDRHGGALTRIALDEAGPVGRFTAWRAQLPIVQWVATK